MTTLPNPLDCCTPCAGARTACTVECDDTGSSVAVPTTVELRAFPGPFTLYQRIDRLGDTTPTDGFGMEYWFNTSSFAADNGTTIIKPDSVDASAAGRWVQWI